MFMWFFTYFYLGHYTNNSSPTSPIFGHSLYLSNVSNLWPSSLSLQHVPHFLYVCHEVVPSGMNSAFLFSSCPVDSMACWVVLDVGLRSVSPIQHNSLLFISFSMGSCFVCCHVIVAFYKLSFKYLFIVWSPSLNRSIYCGDQVCKLWVTEFSGYIILYCFVKRNEISICLNSPILLKSCCHHNKNNTIIWKSFIKSEHSLEV